LVVDDSVVVRALLRDLLTRWGHRVFVVDRLDEAVALMNRVQLDAAITDFNLGGANGLEVCRRLQAIAKSYGRTIPIIVVSGSELSDLSKAAVEAGAIAFVRKPFRPDNICRLLEESFSKSQESGSSNPSAPNS
jgi:CheY-like chemotaxis protein